MVELPKGLWQLEKESEPPMRQYENFTEFQGLFSEPAGLGKRDIKDSTQRPSGK